MFHGCSKLTSLDVSGFNTSSAAAMNDMFYGCSALTSLDLGRWVTVNVYNMNSMFRNCSSLTSLDISRFDTSNEDDADKMFSGCINLETLKWANWKATVDVSQTALTPESTKDIVSKLAMVAADRTLTLGYTLMSYLSTEEISNATNKGWSLVG
jgi:surface protein